MPKHEPILYLGQRPYYRRTLDTGLVRILTQPNWWSYRDPTAARARAAPREPEEVLADDDEEGLPF